MLPDAASRCAHFYPGTPKAPVTPQSKGLRSFLTEHLSLQGLEDILSKELSGIYYAQGIGLVFFANAFRRFQGAAPQGFGHVQLLNTRKK